MNYRTTFDTTNLPANTKKNIKELNEVALQLEKSGKSAKTSVQQASSSSPKGSKRDSTTSNNNSDSDSDGEEETLMPKSNKDQSEKARKKAEWYVFQCLFFLFLFVRYCYSNLFHGVDLSNYFFVMRM